GMKLSKALLLAGALAGVVLAVVLTVAMLRGGGDADEPCTVRAFEGSRFIVCAFDASRQDLRLASRDANGNYLRTFDRLETSLGGDAPRVRFAMNAGMFNSAGAPIGLFVSRGDEQHVLRLTDGPGNFHLKPNGVFWVDDAGAVHVDTSDAFAQAAPHAYWATQ